MTVNLLKWPDFDGKYTDYLSQAYFPVDRFHILHNVICGALLAKLKAEGQSFHVEFGSDNCDIKKVKEDPILWLNVFSRLIQSLDNYVTSILKHTLVPAITTR